MAIVIMIACVVVSLFLHAGLADARSPIRTRGSLRHQRRRASRLGPPSELVEVRPRGGAVHDWGDPVGASHVADLTWAFGLLIGAIVVTLLGWIALGLLGVGGWSFQWCLAVVAVALVLNRRRAAAGSGS